MKSVYYIRHAKSSWEHPGLQDFDRPLNRRGLQDAPMMAEKLFKAVGSIDAILSSPSCRTTQTLDPFAAIFGIDEIRWDQLLYHPEEDYLLDCLFGLEDEVQSVLLFTHNPGITFFTNQFREQPIGNVPTCAITKINFQTDQWETIGVDNGKIDFYMYPKMFK